MINLGLKRAQLEELKTLLRTPHWIKVTVQMLDMEHKYLSDLTPRLMTGQVNFDTSADVVRTLEMELSDPAGNLALNPDSPEDGALSMNRMIRVTYSVAPPIPTKWYDIPLFVGPVTGLKRDGTSVSVSASGKDVLAYSSVWRAKTFKKGRKLTDMMRIVLTEIVGESGRKIAIPDRDRKIAKEVVIGATAIPWKVLKNFAGSIGCQMFYDGRGVCQVRRASGVTLHTFNGSNLTSDVTFTYDPSTIINSVQVIGGKPKGKKKKVGARETAPAAHPLSPRRLGRNGTPRFYTKIIEDSSLKTDKACKSRAKDELERGLKESVNVEFSALPNPLLEEGDTCWVVWDDVSMTFKPVQWAVPLTHDGQMSIGTIRKVSFRTRKKGKKKGGRGKGKNKQRRPKRPKNRK